MKKILVISKQAEEYVNREVYHLLSECEYSIEILVPCKGNKNNISLIHNNKKIRVSRINVWGNHPRIQFIRGLSNKIRDGNPDIIIVDNDIASIIVSQIILIKKRETKIFINTFENFYRNYLQIAKINLLQLKFIRALCFVGLGFLEMMNSKSIDKIFTFSSESLEVNKEKFNNIDVCFMPLGISDQIFHQTTLEELKKFRQDNNIGDKKIVAYFGRVIPEKGLEDLHKLLKMHQKKNEFLVMMDDYFGSCDNYTNFTKKIYTDLYGDDLRLIKANHSDIANYIRNVDIIVCPSHQTSTFKEQYGRIIVEAKLSKTPVICSNSGAFPETHGDPNFIFEAGNQEQMRRAFDYALNVDKGVIDLLYNDALARQTTKVQARALKDIF
jgi:glycosyltransferase involved in cell wall biosynthesis